MGDQELIELKNKIINHYSNIKSLADSEIASLKKAGKYSDDDFTKSFELTEQIQEMIEEIRDLLGDLG